MTVKELIERLKDFPEDMEVMIDASFQYFDVDGIEIKDLSMFYRAKGRNWNKSELQREIRKVVLS